MKRRVPSHEHGSTGIASNKLEEWNQMIDVNIKGVLNGIAAGS